MAEGLNGDVYHDKKMENCKCAMTKYRWYHETKFCIIQSKESVKTQNTKH